MERLTISFAPGEGVIIRIVGLIERRGFDVRSLTVSEADGTATMAVDVEPRDAARRIPVLAQHVGKLVDVRRVSFEQQYAGADA